MAKLRNLGKRPVHLFVINPAWGRRARDVRLSRCQGGACEIIPERELSWPARLQLSAGTGVQRLRRPELAIASAWSVVFVVAMVFTGVHRTHRMGAERAQV